MSQQQVPRGALIAALALIVLSLLAALSGARLGAGRSASVPAPAVIERELRFVDRTEGGVAVYDARTDRLARVLLPGEDGFIRGTLRALAHERKRQGIGSEAPFRLSMRADGRLTLDDPTTGRRIDLDAFGPTNMAAFARFLEVEADSPAHTRQPMR